MVICAYTLARWDQLVLSVESVLRQDPEHETILVVDHNEPLMLRARERWPDLTVIRNVGRRGLSSARNSALAVTGADVVAFLDDDAWADERWLEHLVTPFEDDRVVATGGRALPIWPGATPAVLPPELLWIVGCSYRGLPEQDAEVRNVMGCSMAYRAEPLRELGGFNPDTGRVGRLPIGCEETEVCIRLRAADASRVIRYIPDSVVHHHVSPDRVRMRYVVHRSWCEGVSKAAISRTVGRQQALASESSYVTTVLPSGVARAIGSGPAGWIGASAIVASVLFAALGFARGRLSTPSVPQRSGVRENAVA